MSEFLASCSPRWISKILTRGGTSDIIPADVRFIAIAVRNEQPGMHEWISVNLLYNVIFNPDYGITNKQFSGGLVKWLTASRFPTTKMWFNKVVDTDGWAKVRPKQDPIPGMSPAPGSKKYGHCGNYTLTAGGKPIKYNTNKYAHEFHQKADAIFTKYLSESSFNVTQWHSDMVTLAGQYFTGSVLDDVMTSLGAAEALGFANLKGFAQ